MTYLWKEKKVKQWRSAIPSISTKRTISSQFNSLNVKRDHEIWRKKSRFWLGTGTNMYEW